jgi:hypothetical protein
MNIVSPVNSIHIIPNGILQTNDPEMGNSNINVKITIAGYIAIPSFVMQGPQ